MINSSRILTLLLIFVLVIQLVACAEPGNRNSAGTEQSKSAENKVLMLSNGDDKIREAAISLTDEHINTPIDFAFSLLKSSNDISGNELLSPLSVIIALGLVANGASGETLKEIETMLGMSLEELNEFSNSLSQSLKNTDNAFLVSANSAWLSSDPRLTVKESFIDAIGKYYGAGIYSVDFTDNATLGEINAWVNKNTDGMIDKLLDKLDTETLAMLINALTFDAAWSTTFSSDNTKTGYFTNSDGSKSEVKMMRSSERLSYISGSGCTGFVKPYLGGNYSYVALLPDSGDIDAFIKSLDGMTFLSLIDSGTKETVNVTMPKYSLDYSLSLKDILSRLGMSRAFSQNADFSALGSFTGGNIFISKSLQKTHITVDESGTRAAAVTAFTLAPASAPADPKNVTLDRPFVYAIIDNETNFPVFLGVVGNLS